VPQLDVPVTPRPAVSSQNPVILFPALREHLGTDPKAGLSMTRTLHFTKDRRQ
jgi:hypothetical protein